MGPPGGHCWLVVRPARAAHVRGLRALAFPVDHPVLVLQVEWYRSHDLGRVEELRDCLPGSQPDRDGLQRILACRLVQFHSGGARARCRERDPPPGSRAVRGSRPDRSVPAPGYSTRRCWHHLGLAVFSFGSGQPDPQVYWARRDYPCLVGRLRLGALGRWHHRDLGAARLLYRPAVDRHIEDRSGPL